MFLNLIITTGTLMIMATLIPFAPSDKWWIRSFDFPRLQILIVSSVTFVSFLMVVPRYDTFGYIFIGAVLACLTYQGYMIFPYTPIAKKQVEQSVHSTGDSSLSLLLSNVQMENRNAEALKKMVHKTAPDIILAVETNDWWVEQLKELESDYPHHIYHPQDNYYGLVLFSRLELVNPEIKFLVQDDVPSLHTRVRLRSRKEIELRGLHPRPPFITGDDSSTDRDAELLIVGKETKDINEPTIVLGDMNDVAWSKTNYLFKNISGLLDPRIGRGLYNSFHASYPFLRFPLDHCFHTKSFRLIAFRRLDSIGSDHYPFYIELNYEPDAQYCQEEPEANDSEEEEAEEKIDKGKNNKNVEL